MTHPYRKNL